ncbi:hypothetical protein BEWA_010180 [Theileria equi strain WA]|uniref:Uncharacterized protein n=1 Tax=Theileria equi strain WA TaxID=1537102 RepID=L0B3A8_THEEQ|nr:hypothetical protein BEWA_010180 [Theileria equi strain WA]AFZ81604.1 hypothetical protein BEWA_010180 [Theileria equi strain WA]|eukprot:XP_004831270.1 hypothetical protein BEWA_010180 [Theileria equi strain WA]
MRTGIANNTCTADTCGDVTVVKFLPQSEHQLIGGYRNSSLLIWDLRRCNKPIYALQRVNKTDNESILLGCTITSGTTNMKNRHLREMYSHDFTTEEDVWSYVKQFNSTNSLETEYPRNKRAIKNDERNINVARRKFDHGARFPFYQKSNTFLSMEKSAPKRQHTNIAQEQKFGFPTAIQTTEDCYNMYISTSRGYIDCYDLKTLRSTKTIDTESLMGSFMTEPSDEKYKHQIRIQLIPGEIYIALNIRDNVGFLNLTANSFHKLVKLGWSEQSNPDIDNQERYFVEDSLSEASSVAVTNRGSGSGEAFVTDMAATPISRHLYAINENGDVFLLHPGIIVN